MSLRLIELALFVLPVSVFFLCWWSGWLAPSPAILGFSLIGLVLLGLSLFWFGLDRRIAPGERYVPARIVDGHIEPGHGTER